MGAFFRVQGAEAAFRHPLPSSVPSGPGASLRPLPVLSPATRRALPTWVPQNLYMALKLTWLPLTVWLDAEFFS